METARIERSIEKLSDKVNENENKIIDINTKLGNGDGIRSRIRKLEETTVSEKMLDLKLQPILDWIEERRKKGRNDWLKVKDIILVTIAVGSFVAGFFITGGG